MRTSYSTMDGSTIRKIDFLYLFSDTTNNAEHLITSFHTSQLSAQYSRPSIVAHKIVTDC